MNCSFLGPSVVQDKEGGGAHPSMVVYDSPKLVMPQPPSTHGQLSVAYETFHPPPPPEMQPCVAYETTKPLQPTMEPCIAYKTTQHSMESHTSTTQPPQFRTTSPRLKDFPHQCLLCMPELVCSSISEKYNHNNNYTLS